MDITELAAEWFHYGVDDQFAKVRHDLDRRLVDFANHPYERVQNELTLADGSYAVDTVDFDLMFPFPTLYEYPYENPFDPILRKSVRSLDAAMLLSRGKRELFWTTVMGVSADGKITAESKANVPSLKIKEFDILAFPVTRVLFLKKGPNWKKGELKKKGPR
jgi:hypothetical protein